MEESEVIATEEPTLRLALRAGSRKARDVGYPAIVNGYGWNRFVKMVDRVMPKRGETLELPFPEPDAEATP